MFNRVIIQVASQTCRTKFVLIKRSVITDSTDVSTAQWREINNHKNKIKNGKNCYWSNVLTFCIILNTCIDHGKEFITGCMTTWGSWGLRSWMLYFTQAITALNTCSSLRTLSSSLEIMSISWLAGSSMNSSLSITCRTERISQSAALSQREHVTP